jgi:hypothetical protein
MLVDVLQAEWKEFDGSVGLQQCKKKSRLDKYLGK